MRPHDLLFRRLGCGIGGEGLLLSIGGVFWGQDGMLGRMECNSRSAAADAQLKTTSCSRLGGSKVHQ